MTNKKTQDAYFKATQLDTSEVNLRVRKAAFMIRTIENYLLPIEIFSQLPSTYEIYKNLNYKN